MEDAAPASATVSNLVPRWDDVDSGGSWRPGATAAYVADTLQPPSMVDRLLDDADRLPEAPPYDAMQLRDIARELLRARLVAIAERRERRSAYEIAFILLAAAVAVLLAAPPLVQILLAAHGTQA